MEVFVIYEEEVMINWLYLDFNWAASAEGIFEYSSLFVDSVLSKRLSDLKWVKEMIWS